MVCCLHIEYLKKKIMKNNLLKNVFIKILYGSLLYYIIEYNYDMIYVFFHVWFSFKFKMYRHRSIYYAPFVKFKVLKMYV